MCAMKLTVYVRKANDNSYSCLADKMVSNCLLAGYGESAESALDDFYLSYRELCEKDGSAIPEIEVELKYE